MQGIFMRRMLLLAALAAVAVPGVSYAQSQPGRGLPKIAAYAYGSKDPALCRAVATRLMTALVNSGRYRASEEYREFFEYAAAGHVNAPAPISVGQFKLIGQQFGVDYVCVAEVASVFGEERIFAHIVDVKTAKIVAMGAGDTPLGKPADLTAASDQVIDALLNEAAGAPAPADDQPVPVAADLAYASPPQPPLAHFAPETSDAPPAAEPGDERGTPPGRKVKNGFSMGYGYDPELIAFQLGFAQTRPIAQRIMSFAWEANALLVFPHDYDKLYFYGVNAPLLLQFDLNALSLEAGAQADAIFNNINDDVKFNAGAVAGAGISSNDKLRFYYRFSYGTAYYSHTIGLRVLF
jgi:hypothetical protein